MHNAQTLEQVAPTAVVIAPTKPLPVRITRLADAYYISVAAAEMVNDAISTMQLAIFVGAREEDETIILSIDPDNYPEFRWSAYLTFMGIFQSAKCKVIVKCDKMDFSDCAYFYLLGNVLDVSPVGALFFSPLYSSNKASLCDQERTGADYVIGLLRKAVDRKIITEDQFNQLDKGGYTSVDYGMLKERLADQDHPSIILR